MQLSGDEQKEVQQARSADPGSRAAGRPGAAGLETELEGLYWRPADTKEMINEMINGLSPNEFQGQLLEHFLLLQRRARLDLVHMEVLDAEWEKAEVVMQEADEAMKHIYIYMYIYIYIYIYI